MFRDELWRDLQKSGRSRPDAHERIDADIGNSENARRGVIPTLVSREQPHLGDDPFNIQVGEVNANFVVRPEGLA